MVEAEVEKSLLPLSTGTVVMEPVNQTLNKELVEAEKEFEEKTKEKKQKMKNLDLSQFEITGSTEEWDSAIGKTKSLNAVSIPSTKEKLDKRKSTVSIENAEDKPKKKKKSKDGKKKKHSHST